MNLEEFEKNHLDQKNVITKGEFIKGGHDGTATTWTDQTEYYDGYAETLLILIGGTNPTTTDSHGDWDDEGTC